MSYFINNNRVKESKIFILDICLKGKCTRLESRNVYHIFINTNLNYMNFYLNFENVDPFKVPKRAALYLGSDYRYFQGVLQEKKKNFKV